MDLRELSSALPKPWLNINAHTINADSVTSTAFTASDFVILEQAGVANPTAGKLAIYADLNGELKTNDSAGNVNIVLTQDVAGTLSHIPVYTASGSMLVDSTHTLAEYAPLSGATFTGNVTAPSLYSAQLPVSNWRAAKNSSWSAIGPNNTVESDMINTSKITGSMVIAPSVYRGFTAKLSFLGLFSSGVATTFTIRFKINGTTILTSVIPAGVVVNQYYKLNYVMTIAENSNSRIFISSEIQRSGATPIIDATLNDVVWVSAANNTISVTGQFSDNNGTWAHTQFDMWSGAPQSF